MVREVSQDPASDINAELSKRLAQERVRRGVSKKRLATASPEPPGNRRRDSSEYRDGQKWFAWRCASHR